MRFKISWRNNAYRVSVPRLLTEGESLEVVPATEYDELRDAALDVIQAWERFNNPRIRVGPVYPTMDRLHEVLNAPRS